MTDATPDDIWVVSSGSYSDYRVHAACPSKEDAELLASRLRAAGGYNFSDAATETLPMVSGDVQQVTVLILTTTLWDNGSETATGQQLRVEWPFEGTGVACKWRWIRAPMHNEIGGRLDVQGTDHERVRKVFSDQRAVLISDDAYRAQREHVGGA